jgi:tetratricopeptide (TPR) repeat protein
MGFLHDKNYDYNKAVNCYKQALEVQDGSRLEKAIVNNNLGCLYSRHGNYKHARNYHATAVELIDANQPCWGEFKRNLTDVENTLNT